MAKRRLKKFKGKVVAVTGSVGKTSTKEAIFTVLNSQFKVKKSKKSMNTDIGLLLTILDIESGFSSATKWSWFLLKGFFHSFFRDHSEVLLLEFGVDKPGDMDFLLSVVKPDIAVMTNIFPVHLDNGQFKDLQDIFDEKKKMVEKLKDNGVAILNIDNTYVEHLAKSRGKRKTVTYGKNDNADFWASNIKSTVEGTTFTLHNGDHKFPVKVKVLGDYQVYVLMPAIICGHLFGMSVETAIAALERSNLPPGRLNIIPGKEGITILDSSYNSSPAALNEALKVLKDVGVDRRKVAVLGNMNELGEESQVLHEMVGDMAAKCCDLLITVGSQAKFIAEKATPLLGEENVFSFKNVNEAIEFYKERLKEDDLVLAKGSQNNVRLEKFVKEFMAHPEEAKELLVRQEKVWQAKL